MSYDNGVQWIASSEASPYWWVSLILNWVGVNLECVEDYGAWERANDLKLHIFAIKHKADTYSKHWTHSDDCVYLQLSPTQIYGFSWNPRIVRRHQMRMLRYRLSSQRLSVEFTICRITYLEQQYQVMEQTNHQILVMALDRHLSYLSSQFPARLRIPPRLAQDHNAYDGSRRNYDTDLQSCSAERLPSLGSPCHNDERLKMKKAKKGHL